MPDPAPKRSGRPLTLTLLTAAAAGVLLQLGPAQASFERPNRAPAAPTKQ